MWILHPWQLVIAFVLDLILGDPRWLPHPVRWMGKLVFYLEALYYDSNSSRTGQRLRGVFMWLTVIIVVGAGTTALLAVSRWIHQGANQIIVIWLTFAALAVRSLHSESYKVIEALKTDDLARARRDLAKIVSRDTTGMRENEIIRAVLETVAENISDGIVAPLFYLTFGGPVAAMVYKAVNTMDSMIGYKNERYLHFGWFAAKADDLFNWIPARVSALAIAAAAALGGMDVKGSWQTICHDAFRTESPNAGFPEAAVAGALGVRLGGENMYFGEVIVKPYLGSGTRHLTISHYHQLIRLMYLSAFIVLGLYLSVLWVMNFCILGEVIP